MISGGYILKVFIDILEAIAVVVLIAIGIGIIIYFIPSVLDKGNFFIESMLSNSIMALLLLVIFSAVLWKFFSDKKEGYGLYTTSTLLITLALMVTSVGFLLGKIESRDITNIILAIVGFAGGLVAGKSKKKPKKKKNKTNP